MYRRLKGMKTETRFPVSGFPEEKERCFVPIHLPLFHQLGMEAGQGLPGIST
jgi:hypothetical protein